MTIIITLIVEIIVTQRKVMKTEIEVSEEDIGIEDFKVIIEEGEGEEAEEEIEVIEEEEGEGEGGEGEEEEEEVFIEQMEKILEEKEA